MYGCESIAAIIVHCPLSIINSVSSNPGPSILFITRKWYGRGGLQRYSRDLCEELGRTYGMRFHCIRPSRAARLALPLFCIRALLDGIRLGRAGWRVHIGDAALLPIGACIKCIAGVPLTVTVSGLDVVYPASWYQHMVRILLPKADKVVCLSEAAAREAAARGVKSERIVVIPCGIDRSGAGDLSNREENLLLTVGRLIERKGIAWFLERVFPLLLKEVPDARYVIAGAGPEEAKLRQLVHDLHLTASVMFAGEVSDLEKDALFDRAALFVMPNVPVEGDMEGFGIVCIEAAARGVPVVASRIDGIPDAVVEGETGMLFAPGDVQDCLRVLLSMLRSPPDSSAVSESAWNKYNWSALTHRYRALVFEV